MVVNSSAASRRARLGLGIEERRRRRRGGRRFLYLRKERLRPDQRAEKCRPAPSTKLGTLYVSNTHSLTFIQHPASSAPANTFQHCSTVASGLTSFPRLLTIVVRSRVARRGLAIGMFPVIGPRLLVAFYIIRRFLL